VPLLQRDHAPEEVEAGEGRLPAVPGEVDERARAGVDEGADVGLQDRVRHAVRLPGREEAGLAEVVAVIRSEVAEGPIGFAMTRRAPRAAGAGTSRRGWRQADGEG